MLKLNNCGSYLKPKTPLHQVVISHRRTPTDSLRSLRPCPSALVDPLRPMQYCHSPQRSQNPRYLQMELSLLLTTGSSNYKTSLRSMLTTFLHPKPGWPMSSAVLVETPRPIYVRNTPRTQQTPSSLK